MKSKWTFPNIFQAKTFRDYAEFDDHEMLIVVSDEVSGLSGYIGIHDTTLGPALGGTRLQTYINEEEALKDALNLSRAMSYKCALAGLPYGGGKGVIYVKDSAAPDKEALLAAYARMVESLRGLFKTGTDVGISDQDVQIMGAHTSHMLGLTEADRGNLSTSSCAALGVFYSIQSALTVLNKTAELKGITVAVKGVGKLGGELARLLHEAGASVVVADTNQENIQKLTESLKNISVVDVEMINQQEVDIYAPCALGAEFDEAIIKKLKCRAIVGGANNQLSNSHAGHLLHNKGILYAPDYVANAGGLIYVADELESGGFSQARVLDRVEGIQRTMLDIFERSQQEKLPTSVIADQIAQERMQLENL